MRRDEVSVKLGVSACLETDKFELVELPGSSDNTNMKSKIKYSFDTSSLLLYGNNMGKI